ncbi:MAG: DNA internalization-related competence protein ComEC/Rec2 [Deltaproteobacteria bacterium]|nr:DNA internalization-related competence protein ComEC/Rec2 [Deltaproteobacteria bacterium]
MTSLRSPLALLTTLVLFASAVWPSAMTLGARALVTLVAALGALALARRRGPLLAVSLCVVAVCAGGLVVGRDGARSEARPRRAVSTGLLSGIVEASCTLGFGQRRCVVAEQSGSRTLLVVAPERCAPRAGDHVTAVVTHTPLQPMRNTGLQAPGDSLAQQGVTGRAVAAACEVTPRWPTPLQALRRLSAVVRVGVEAGLERVFVAQARERARALLFGDDDGIEQQTLESFRLTGLSHLLAVSGAHVALLAVWIEALVRRVARRCRPVVVRGWSPTLERLLPIPFLVLFVLATGEAPSAIRALVMALLSVFARQTQRRVDGASLLAASVLLTLAMEPAWRTDLGWQLSIAASWALISAPRTSAQEPEGPWWRRVVDTAKRALVASVRVALLTAPIVAPIARSLPVTSLLANLVAAPLGEVLALPLVLGASLLGMVSQRLGALVAVPASWALRGLFWLPMQAERLPWSHVEAFSPTAGQTVVWLVLVSVGLYGTRRWLTHCLLAALLLCAGLEVMHRAWEFRKGTLRLTVIDVGQGDALLVTLPDGEAMLIDAGGVMQGADPGARAVLPTLALRRRSSLVAVVASHPHPDHVRGLEAVLAHVRADEIWDNRQCEGVTGEPSWCRVRDGAVQRGSRLRGPSALCQGPVAFHGATLQVLAPCPGARPGQSANDASIVLRISYQNASMLLTGDLEATEETRLLRGLTAIEPVTVLKLGHHGSRTSSSAAWLEATRPRLAVASMGHPSPYGHPHREVINRLQFAGISLHTTAAWGMLEVSLGPGDHACVSHVGGTFCTPTR